MIDNILNTLWSCEQILQLIAVVTLWFIAPPGDQQQD